LHDKKSTGWKLVFKFCCTYQDSKLSLIEASLYGKIEESTYSVQKQLHNDNLVNSTNF